MNEVRTLLEQFWISRETDKETYFRVKRDIPRFRKFLQEQLGWRLIQNEKLLKLEKIPAHAESFVADDLRRCKAVDLIEELAL